MLQVNLQIYMPPCHDIADAQEHPSYGNWAGCINKSYSRLGMASPFLLSCTIGLNFLGSQAKMEGQLCKVWDGLRVFPGTALSKGGKLFTYLASQLRALLMTISCLQLLQSRIGSRALLGQHGTLARPAILVCATALYAVPRH